MTNIRWAADALERAEAATEKRRELHRAIRAAFKAGESPTLIAEVSGLTRGRIYQIVHEED